VSPVELPIALPAPPDPRPANSGWLADARRARQLSWASLVWMSVEGIVGLISGFDAHSLSLIIWAASSFVEGLASMIVIWRFTGSRIHSATSERSAQRLVAGTFLLLVPYFLYETATKLANGSDTRANAAGLAITGSAIVLMPSLGWAKVRLARRLDSSATSGEGIQNLMCAAQAATALFALIAASAGLSIVDPLAALVVSAIAVRESLSLWQGEDDDCCGPVGFQRTSTSCPPDNCDCC
jgi:divalent metal cation (Fe/Co/Zn/Cd) transporter